MEICFTINGVRHCLWIPILTIPIDWRRPGPGPVNYPALFQDAMILGSIREIAKQLGNADVGRAVSEGVAAGLHAMQKHVGGYAEIQQMHGDAAH